MSRIVRAAAATAALIVTMGVGALPAAAAESACNLSVVDTTAAQVLDVAAIEAAIMEVEAYDFDIYVRAFETTPDGTLEDHFYLSLPDCNAWSNESADGRFEPKGNVVWIGFGMDRTSFIYAGGHYEGVLTEQVLGEIRTEMGNHFRDGDFTGGITSAVYGVRDATLAPAPQPAQPAPVVDAKAWEAVGAVVLWILGGFVALVLILGAVIFLVQRRDRIRDEREALASAKEAARANYKELTTAYLKWDDKVKFLPIEFDSALALLSEPLRARHVGARQRIIDGVKQGLAQFAEIPRRQLDPSRDDLETDRYDYMARWFAGVLATFDEAAQALGDLKEEIDDDVSRYSFEGQGSRWAEATELLGGLLGIFAGYDKVFNVDEQLAQLRRYAKQLKEADELLSARQSQERSDRLISEVEEGLEELDRLASEWHGAAESLKDPIGVLRGSLDEARAKAARYKKIDTTAAEVQLEAVGRLIDQMDRRFNSDETVEVQLGYLNEVLENIGSVMSDLAAAEKKRQRKIEKERREREERERRDDYTGAIVGGAIGYTIGSSHSSSSYGGGGFGGFGGGGSSSGGSWGGGGGGSSSGGGW